MKIGYLLQQGEEIRTPPFNGPATHVREVVRAFRHMGHQVRVLVRLDETIWQSDDLETFTPVHVQWMDQGPLRLFESAVRRVQYELQLPYAALFESVRFALACKQALAGFDVLLERMSWVSYGGALAARWLDTPLVLENNGDHLADLEAKGMAPSGLQRRLSVGLMQRAVNGAAHVVASGDGWRTQFIQRWGAPPETVTVVENGTALVRALQRPRLHSFRDGADGAGMTLVYLGGFTPWQGVPVLLRAAAQSVARGAPLRLLLIGAGDGLGEARQLAADLGLGERATFPGRLTMEKYGPLLADADVGVAPYCGWNEFSGLKIFDYKAAGLATIASGRDGQPATLTHEQTGLIVPPCDETALRDAILRLAEDAPLRRRLGRNARIEAEQCHGWEHTARQLERVCRQVVGER